MRASGSVSVGRLKKENVMDEDQGSWVKELVETYVKTSHDNRLRRDASEPAWDEVLVGFSSGADPLFEAYKTLVGPSHWTPLEIFGKTFPGSNERAEELTVISWILPQRAVTRKDNRKEDFYPAERWVRARFAGEDFNNSLRRHVVAELHKIGVKAVAPSIAPDFKWEKSPQYVYASVWSERHAAYAAGLGTFGLCDALITEKGKAHRVGSVVAGMVIPAGERPYDDHHAYCQFFLDQSCMVCAKRCPVDAISEKGHDKKTCWSHAGGTCAQYVKEHYGFDGYGCGLCQTGVPCESGIPEKVRKALKLG